MTTREQQRQYRQAQREAAEFNEAHPEGTPVRCWYGSKREKGVLTWTRSPAWAIPSGKVLVTVRGYAGGIALTHVEVIHEPDAMPVNLHDQADPGAVLDAALDVDTLARIVVSTDRLLDGDADLRGLVEVEPLDVAREIRAHLLMNRDVERFGAPSSGACDAAADVMESHRPILNPSYGQIVGCHCMNRVFIQGQESWPEHIAQTLESAGLLRAEATAATSST